MSLRPCVFLDRDGVINRAARKSEYITAWDQFELLPNIADWIRLFNTLGYLVIVVTNQRAVSLGQMSEETLNAIHQDMVEQLGQKGARIDDVYYCPHAEQACQCRKPEPGMVEAACQKWPIDLNRSLMIGDSDNDAQLAARCGLAFLRADGRGGLCPPAL
jgi:D-glycero-D-manno-heptose 1,7-bisphosphate phosphatase